jgi:predicted transcriptional regulator
MNTELRDKDIAVLQALQEGASTVTEIKEATTLTRRQINYSINEKSLEELGLVEVNRSEGRLHRESNGREENIWKPKQLQLTDKGLQKLAQEPTETAEKYENMSREELIQTVHELETRQDRLENMFKDFRNKVMEQI